MDKARMVPKEGDNYNLLEYNEKAQSPELQSSSRPLVGPAIAASYGARNAPGI